MIKKGTRNMKEKCELRINHLEIGENSPVRIMGVLNVSGESFYQGSIVTPKNIREKALEMVENGADILDVGGRSTAPWSPIIDVKTERERVLQAIKSLLPVLIEKDVILSVDTQYREVAEIVQKILESEDLDKSLMINDVSGLKTDHSLAKFIVEHDIPVSLMACHDKPGDTLGIDETIKALNESVGILEKLNHDVHQKVIIDPAIGKWTEEKVPELDLELIHDLKKFKILGFPVLVAISRKSFLGAILDEKKPENRFYGTLAATAIAIFNGAHVIRTHDVNKATKDVVKTAQAIKKLKF
ncbi:MAG: dihydropteroate synthase [Promethearchaeota archaeon]